jgi:hypothetical protein
VPEVPHDTAVGLRLELGRERDRADAFAAALKSEVLAIVGRSVAQATYDAREDLATANAQIKALEQQVATLYADVDRRELAELRLFWLRMQKTVAMQKERGFGGVAFMSMVSDLVAQRWRKEKGKKQTLHSKQVLEKLDAYEVSWLDTTDEGQSK